MVSGIVYILSVMKQFTRYSEFIPFPNLTSEQEADSLLQHVITKFGAPKCLITDKGENVTSELTKLFCKFLWVWKRPHSRL